MILEEQATKYSLQAFLSSRIAETFKFLLGTFLYFPNFQ